NENYSFNCCHLSADDHLTDTESPELSVCMLLRHNVLTEWTGFAYKAPGGRNIELGLQGKDAQLKVWLFGNEKHLPWELKSNEWSSVCLTWSGRARRLRTYINGTIMLEAPLNPSLPQRLAPNGTLTLGVSHYVDADGKVRPETSNELLGEIGLFRIWSREWSGEELKSHSCADGDVVSWDLQENSLNYNVVFQPVLPLCTQALTQHTYCSWIPASLQLRRKSISYK
uniref:Pentaxin n=1 Tax=Seriola dumerili TaxID=41447 RepID=A0A3B4T3K0_SERDU